MTRRQTDFEIVYAENVRAVYAFVAYRLRSREHAEDLTQATFERALRSWARFDPTRASERTWLLAIARNLVIDSHRQKQATPVPEVEDHAFPAVDGPEESFGLAPELEVALETLSERDREVVALRFGGDLTGPEIAAMLGLTLPNVQQILSRSLRKLRDELSGTELRPASGSSSS